MERKIGKNEPEFLMFKDYWHLFEKYNVPENNDAYWQAVINASNEFYEKYKGSAFAKALTMALVDELERKHKERYGKGV